MQYMLSVRLAALLFCLTPSRIRDLPDSESYPGYAWLPHLEWRAGGQQESFQCELHTPSVKGASITGDVTPCKS
jgi:hypothetical protein